MLRSFLRYLEYVLYKTNFRAIFSRQISFFLHLFDIFNILYENTVSKCTIKFLNVCELFPKNTVVTEVCFRFSYIIQFT